MTEGVYPDILDSQKSGPKNCTRKLTPAAFVSLFEMITVGVSYSLMQRFNKLSPYGFFV